MQMLGGRDSGGSNASYDDMNQDQGTDQGVPARQSAPAAQAAKPAAGGSSFDEFDDDIPF